MQSNALDRIQSDAFSSFSLVLHTGKVNVGLEGFHLNLASIQLIGARMLSMKNADSRVQEVQPSIFALSHVAQHL